MHTLRYVRTNICERMQNSASTLVYAAYVRDKFSIRYKQLQYGGIRCHTAKRSHNFVHSYTLDIS